MPEPVWKLLLQYGALGAGAGVAISMLWPLVNRFLNGMMRQMEKRIEESERRLAAAEKRLNECEDDREKLHKEFANLLLSLRPNP